MKILLTLVFIVLSGCASKAVIVKDKCDPIMHREDQFVCGKERVLKACRDVGGRSEIVCDEL
jgi:hypothetical protein